MKNIFWLILFGLVVFFGYRFFNKENADVITVGVVFPFSGSTASYYGEYGKRGLDIALEQINGDGGVNGKKIKLVYEDSRGENKVGLEAFNKLASEGIKVVIGDILSGPTLSMAPVAEQNKIILIAPGSASPKVTEAGDYIFRTKVSAAVESKAAAEFIVHDLKSRRIAFLYQNTDYGVGVFNAMKADLGKQHVSFSREETFSADATDMRSQLLKLKSADADYILLVGFPKQIGLILKQAKELGIAKRFFAHSGSVGPEVLSVGGAAADGLVFLSEMHLDSMRPETKAFIDTYYAKHQENPELFSSLSYDTLFLVRGALRECGMETECIKGWLYNVSNFIGVTGGITFDGNGDVVRNSFTPMMVSDGKFAEYK